MTISSIQQFSTAAASNTDINGINVNTGWPPSNVGNAFRTLMAFLADNNTGAAAWSNVKIGDASGTLGSWLITPDTSSPSLLKFEQLNNGGTVLATPLTLGGSSLTFGVPVTSTSQLASTVGVVTSASSVGNAQMFPGDATHPGYVAFTNAAGTRVGFAGYSDGSNRLELEVEGGYTGWHVVGGNLVIDSTSYIAGSQIVTANGGSYAINITGSAGSVAWLNVTGTPGQVYGLNQYVNTTSNVTFNNITANGYIQVNGSTSLSGAGYTMSSSAPANVSWGPLSAGVNLGPGLWYVGYGIACSSDARVKFEIKDISEEDGVDWIMKGRPRTYIMAGRRRAGFIAQEDMAAGRGMAVMQVADEHELFAESDGYADAGHRLTRDYEHDVAYLTAALKSALKRIEALEARLA